ncbi:unnamed protein product [Rotaria socialis]|uniref:Serine/threonine-protein kinase D1-3-like ubiquitin-like domain-containing protein n=1 Tax=Rotaria socialis TaxID=392032 RepID=A0A821PLP3_9BILA|nr:unnamed protein product [Rotaria socialis]CAF4806979.1 unnamed protein product [Rotaria socialis]
MNPFSSTINTLCEVAIRFIQTMCPDQDIKLLHNRILLFRYDPSSYQMIISLSPKDILIPDTTQVNESDTESDCADIDGTLR